MSFLNSLCCPSCRQSSLDFSQLVYSEGQLDLGSIRCDSCNHLIEVIDGVICYDASSDMTHTKSDRKNAKAYSSFWEKSHEEFKKDRYSDESQLLKVWSDSISGKSVLDAGCGSGRHMEHWIKLGASSLICIDLSDAIFQARKDFNELNYQVPALFLKGSISKIPLKSDLCDFVWSSGTVGLIDDQEVVVKELLRVSSQKMLLGVLTDKTLTGKIYIGANHIKPMLHKVFSFSNLFSLAGLLAKLLKFWIHVLYRLKVSTKLFTSEAITKIIEDKSSTKRLQISLYDPLIIPKVIKHPDAFYIKTASDNGFKLASHRTEIICDYFEFQKNKI